VLEASDGDDQPNGFNGLRHEVEVQELLRPVVDRVQSF
jgi:hypothetical protein